MRFGAVVALAGLAGCQLLLDINDTGHDASAPPSDASAEASAADVGPIVDAGTPRCDPTKPFAAPQPIAALSAHHTETSARASEDESTIWFDRDGALWIATRGSTDGGSWDVRPFQWTTIPLTDVGRPFVHGTEIYFDSQKRLYAATYDAAKDTVDAPHELFALNQAAANVAQGDAWLGASTGTLYFSRFTTAWGVYAATTLTGPATKLDLGDAQSVSASFTPDERTVYYSRGADYRIVRAARASATAPFVDVEAISWPDSSSYQEFPRWISADECVLYVMRQDTSNDHEDMFRAQRPK